ncbi:MAG: SPOR domain-containing protein [Betaproteobacteria bacterium]
MAEPADVNLDELKRRGRRRLIGAIVLALVAAVVVPMLLESDPRPLGEDVSVRIPPVDDGKFVNKLNDPRAKADVTKTAPSPAGTTAATTSTPPPSPAAPTRDAAPASAAVPTGTDPPRKSLADAEKGVLAPGARIPASEPKAAPKTPDAPKQAEPAKGTDAAPARTADASPAKAAPTSSVAEPVREGFVVQLAAFSDDKGANALAGKLKRGGYPAYTEAIATSRGTLWRVRVGGYPSRDAAAQSRDRLKGEGHAGIVVPAK